MISLFLLTMIPHTWSREPSSPEANPEVNTEAGGFFQNLTLSHPAGLKVTASDAGYLHVAAILQIVAGKDFKPGFRSKADNMVTSLLRHQSTAF
jgi:hypothetical protein